MKDQAVRRTVSIDSIKIQGRHRSDLGDLDGLRASIKESGLLHPLVVTRQMRLVAGERRLKACKQLGWKRIPVTQVTHLKSAADLLRAERDENTCRLDMSLSEKLALGRDLEALERPRAEARKAATQAKPGERVGAVTVTEPSSPGDTRDIVGGAVGMSGVSYSRAKAVAEAAEKDPESYGDLATKMHETGTIKPVHDELQARRKAQRKKPRDPRNNGRERVGSRTVKQAVASLRQVAINVDSAAAGFDMDSFGDLSLLAPHPAAQEWVELLSDASRRLSAHIRTLRRYQKEAQ